jgi:hypothetical protein
MDRRPRRPLLALFTVLSAVCACQKPPRSRGEAVGQMVRLQESGHYDDAVRVVDKWMGQHQDDTSQDDFLHQQIAMVYISKAYHKQSTRDESLDNAASHLETALGIYAAKKPQEVDIMLFEIGGAYEILGDLTTKDKCRFFGKARSLLDEQLPLIKGDSYTAYGHTTPLEPVRADVRKHLAAVEKKAAQTGCSTP